MMNFRSLKALLFVLCLAIGYFLANNAFAQALPTLKTFEKTAVLELDSSQILAFYSNGHHAHPQIDSARDNMAQQSVIWTGLNKIVREAFKVFKGPRHELANTSVSPQGCIPATCEFARLPFHLERTFLRAQLLASIPHPPTLLT